MSLYNKGWESHLFRVAMDDFDGANTAYPSITGLDDYLSITQQPEDFGSGDAMDLYLNSNLDEFSMDPHELADLPDFNASNFPTSPEQSFSAAFNPNSIQQQPGFKPSSTSPVASETTATPTSPTAALWTHARKPSASSRKVSELTPSLDGNDPKDSLTVSAEEDKRRRNTAASARFRVKKKQREQQMEKTAKEMTDRCNKLESRISELEKENRLLKGLLTEKAGKGKAVTETTSSSGSDEEAVTTRSSKRVKSEAIR